MGERPILFSGPMVRAILSGAKTQTRRVLKSQPYEYDGRWWIVDRRSGDCHLDLWARGDVGCRPYFPGDRLWVRERAHIDGRTVNYAADCDPSRNLRGLGYRPSIFLPRWASRITLDVTEVRVQRLQEISEADALAEGALLPWTGFDKDADTRTALSEFEALWNVINGDCAWAANPWVVALTFVRVPSPEDGR